MKKELTIHESKNAIDFGKYANLETLNVTFNKEHFNLNKLVNLKHLTIWNYEGEDLSILESLTNIEELSFYDAKFKTLAGVDNLKKLKRLVLERCKKLTTIHPIVNLQETLTILEIRHCKLLNEYNNIASLTNLTDLYLIACGDVENANFLDNLKSLKYASIDINILDGQVEKLLDKPIRFKNYKHFNHKNTLKIKIKTNIGNFLERNGELLTGQRI